jgi:DNA processing protein
VPNAPGTSVSALIRGNRVHELAALAVLIKSKLIRPQERLSAEVEHFGAVDTLKRVVAEPTLTPLALDEDLIGAIAVAEGWMREDRDIRTVFDNTYPSNLSVVFDKPPLIFIKGEWREDLDGLAVAVVGTRKPSAEGVKRAQVAARRLAQEGVTVISGLAVGIDNAAHTAALDADGRTVAVIGTGIDRVYPRENAALAARIVASSGALVSQFFPDQPPTQWSFPMRNVTMSGLSLATLVIEAGETSGARQQARHALMHGRTVFLASSLVRQHTWARKMMDEGYGGARALAIESIDEVIDRLLGAHDVPAVAVG